MHLFKKFKIVISKEEDGYVGYPLGLEGIVIGEGDTYEEALRDTKSAIKFHIETFGLKVIKKLGFPKEAFIAETEVAIS
ncbi:MAG: type II toxin-antitoxin system HicB family antitoxin [Candidatus Omnitrophica bacterium]|nr:type II toxin-antitoxin system HicB family antitoxin [Candidatus Omnitrophota bacterium]